MDKIITVEELAKKLGNVQSDALIDKLNLVGINISKNTDKITLDQQQKLLASLKQPNKISLKRRSSTQMNFKSASGVNTTVNVVRKNRRIYVKDDALTKDIKEVLPKINENDASSNNLQPEVNGLVTTNIGQNLDIKHDVATENATLLVSPSEDVNSKEKKLPLEGTSENKTLEQPENTKSAAKGAKGKKDKKTLTEEEDYKVLKKSKATKSKVRDKHEIHPAKITLNVLSKVVDNEDLVEELEERKILTRKIKSTHKINKSLPTKNLHAFEKPTVPIKYEIELPFSITVAELSQKISVKSSELIKVMMKMEIMATINQSLDQDTACLIVEEMGHKAILENPEHLEDSIVIEYKSTLEPRSPIVTVMGHVDHGKTSLLDYIRSTKVTSKEAGGITQHIGAYQVPTKHHGMITFLDTPGHSAFTAMRARGANCTDIVVLVVAADDSVMPQTIEAIQHAKAAMVPIIVAINKIDKPNIDPDKVINDLSQHGIMPEEWGGENIFVKISAKTGEGIDILLESIALQAEMLELKAPYIGAAQGVIIESSLDKSRGGIIATLLIQTGTLNKGDIILAGLEYGKIKALKNDNGESINQAGPSMPVEVLGLSYAPLAGDKFQVVADERKAKEVAERRQNLQKEELLSRQQAVKFSGFMDKMKKTNEIKFINILLKADVQGSLEAIADALDKLSTDQVKINIIGKSVGGFNESDVNLAIASKAFLLGFNVRAELPAKLLAKTQEKEFNYYSIIYDLINGVQAVIDGNTTVPVKEIIIGVAEVRDVFRSSKFGTVAGCLVKEGIIKRGNPIRVLRDNVVIYSGELESLRRFKENVNEVRNATECGIGVKNYNDVKVKDQIEVFEILTIDKNPNANLELKK